jgi:SAM-dependent methyltransferase
MMFHEAKNRFNWWLKQKLTWSASVHKRLAMSFDHIFRDLPAFAQRRTNELMAKYEITNWPMMCSEQQLLINLYVLDVMDRSIPQRDFSSTSLDIGSATWTYLPALVAFSGGDWLGVEIDAHQRYMDFTTRRGHAMYMMQFYSGSRYHCGSVLEVEETFGLITWLLPYVVIDPLHAAGLPARYYEPRTLLQHVWQCLRPGGTLFIINQGQEEAAAQDQLFAETGIDTAGPVELTSCYSVFKKQRFAWCVTRQIKM